MSNGKPRNNPFQKPQIAPMIIPGVRIDDLRKVACKCGKELFAQVFTIFFASPLQSVNGMPTIVQIPSGLICSTCGEINAFQGDFMPSPTNTPEPNKEEPEPESDETAQ